MCEAYGKEAVKEAANLCLAGLRERIANGCTEEELKEEISHIPAEICRKAGAASPSDTEKEHREDALFLMRILYKFIFA